MSSITPADIPNNQKSLMDHLKRNLILCTSSSVWVVAATSKLFKSRYDIFHLNFGVFGVKTAGSFH